jgi:hypothetical protein
MNESKWMSEKKKLKIFENDVRRCEMFAIACLDRNKWLSDRDKRARLFLHLKFFDKRCWDIERGVLRYQEGGVEIIKEVCCYPYPKFEHIN